MIWMLDLPWIYWRLDLIIGRLKRQNSQKLCSIIYGSQNMVKFAQIRYVIFIFILFQILSLVLSLKCILLIRSIMLWMKNFLWGHNWKSFCRGTTYKSLKLELYSYILIKANFYLYSVEEKSYNIVSFW